MGHRHLKWDDLRLFLEVAEQGSFSAASRALKLGQPTLSRRISELEAAIGDALFFRQNQGVSLTDAGYRLLPSAQHMAQWAVEAEQSVSPQGHRLTGRVRIAAPPGIAQSFVVPLALDIQSQQPAIQIDVLSGIELLNLSRGDADLAIRNKAPTDSDLICIDSVESPVRVIASLDYANHLPNKFTVSDLDWISWTTPFDTLMSAKELKKRIANFNPIFTSDDFLVQLAACQAGLGVMLFPHASHFVSELNQLVVLDVDLGKEADSVLYLVCHKRQRHLPKVSLVIDAISRRFSTMR